jgi:uncharacterized protein with PIN domain/sulfur carrier protein ThiS
MLQATFRFYEELNDFLPKGRRKVDFPAAFKEKRSIKDMIESLGVPHTEVDLILVNGQSVDFAYILEDGDRVSVYPTFESFNIEPVTRLRRMPLRKTRFVADINLGDIVKCMRTLGFDVYFDPGLSNRQIVDISIREKRIILTKSKSLLKFKDVTHGVFIRSGTREQQVVRIMDTLDIKDKARPFSRCLRCNGSLKRVAKEDVLDRIPEKTKACCDEYCVCESCHKLYWNGTHMIRLTKMVDQILR